MRLLRRGHLTSCNVLTSRTNSELFEIHMNLRTVFITRWGGVASPKERLMKRTRNIEPKLHSFLTWAIKGDKKLWLLVRAKLRNSRRKDLYCQLDEGLNTVDNSKNVWSHGHAVRLLTDWLSDYMEVFFEKLIVLQRPKKLPTLDGNRKCIMVSNNSPQLIPILSLMNQFHPSPFYVSKIHSNIILPSYA
jgi:hypothetical protein